jgi:hypothetical protein
LRLIDVRVAGALALLCVTGCGDGVSNPISPQDARRQVVDASRQVVTDLRAEVAKAKFGYDSCNDQGDAPFRGHGNLILWMPGADRASEVSPDTVLNSLRQRGWQADPDFASHGTTFTRDGVDVSVWIIPPPKPDSPPVGHVIVDVFGECRDAFDHRIDHTDRLSEDIREDIREDGASG